MANKYCLEKCIGRGNFGDVYKAAEIKTGGPVAIKVVNLDEAPDDMFFLVREIQFLSTLRSPYVVEYLEAFAENVNMWIVMGYCGGGSVADVLRTSKKFLESVTAYVIRLVLLGLEYLHGQKTVHRDIKLANILVTTDGAIKLGDFGVSGCISYTNRKKNTFVGTPYWMAPEVIVHNKHGYNEKADIWSTGITTIELIKGSPPLAEYDPMKIIFQIPQLEPPLLKGDKYSEELKSFLERCLVKDPRQRSSSVHLLQHPFVALAAGPEEFRKLLRRRRSIFDRCRRRPRNPLKQKTAGPAMCWDFSESASGQTAENGPEQEGKETKDGPGNQETDSVAACNQSPAQQASPASPQHSPDTAATSPQSGQVMVLEDYPDFVRLCLLRVKARATREPVVELVDMLERHLLHLEERHAGFCQALVSEVVHVYSKVNYTEWEE